MVAADSIAREGPESKPLSGSFVRGPIPFFASTEIFDRMKPTLVLALPGRLGPSNLELEEDRAGTGRGATTLEPATVRVGGGARFPWEVRSSTAVLVTERSLSLGPPVP